MPRCPTFTFQLSIISKWTAKDISTKGSFKITEEKTCYHWFTLNLNKKPVFLFGNLKWLSYWNNSFAFISARYTVKFTKQKWNNYINENWHINLYMDIGISNRHNWIFGSTKMKFFNSFHFLTLLLTFKYLKILSTLPVVRNWAMWKTSFSAPQNAKKENQVKHKKKCVKVF